MWWIAVLSLAVAIGRLFVPGHDLSWAGTYEAFAHIWVGALIVLAWQDRDKRQGWTSLICLLGITLLETVMFMLKGG